MKDLKKYKEEHVEDEFKYPPSEDIYNQSSETNIDAETFLEKGILRPKENKNKKGEEELPGEGLDIPGSELDNEQEQIGSEDEENNYYSLGGDNHDD
jgi:hypothetical protein